MTIEITTFEMGICLFVFGVIFGIVVSINIGLILGLREERKKIREERDRKKDFKVLNFKKKEIRKW